MQFYLGKHVAYVYKVKGGQNKSVRQPLHIRCISQCIDCVFLSEQGLKVAWGKITRSHGNAGGVRAHFRKPLPPTALAQAARVVRFLSNQLY